MLKWFPTLKHSYKQWQSKCRYNTYITIIFVYVCMYKHVCVCVCVYTERSWHNKKIDPAAYIFQNPNNNNNKTHSTYAK